MQTAITAIVLYSQIKQIYFYLNYYLMLHLTVQKGKMYLQRTNETLPLAITDSKKIYKKIYKLFVVK